MPKKKWITRRSFLKAGLTGAVGVSVGGAWWVNNHIHRDSVRKIVPSGYPLNPSPIMKIEGNPELEEFSGDDPHRAHPILWDKTGFLKRINGLPPSSENADVIVIGGGIAGLASAYYLRDQKPIVLEQSLQFGGNSKGEEWGGIAYSIGAAYITRPAPDLPSSKLLKDIGLTHFRSEESANAHVLIGKDKKILSPFWTGASDPARAAEFVHVRKTLLDIGEKSYPDIPLTSQSMITKEKLLALDRMSYKDWINQTFPKLHPHIEEFFTEYAWSSFAGDIEEISAAQMIGFLSGDLAGISAFPGGNAAITQRLYEKLKGALPSGHLRDQALVIDVRVEGDGVKVSYVCDGETKTVSAKACVFAAPKFVAKKVINDLPQDQLDAMMRLKYRAYLVANVLINKKIPSPSYDLFRLAPAEIHDYEHEARSRAFTDLIFGSWASHDQSEKSVLTLYRGCPYDSARSELYGIDAFPDTKTLFESSLPDLLTALSLSLQDVETMRITRWGHALPLAEKGLYADGVLARANQPLKGRIFFAHQDNWANPCFETASAAAFDAVGKLLKSLKM
jgi:protoporphyrinogen oxidase